MQAQFLAELRLRSALAAVDQVQRGAIVVLGNKAPVAPGVDADQSMPIVDLPVELPGHGVLPGVDPARAVRIGQPIEGIAGHPRVFHVGIVCPDLRADRIDQR